MTRERSAPLRHGKLDHVAFEVENLQEAVEFYTQILGLKELRTPQSLKAFGVVWLEWRDGSVLHLVQNEQMSPSVLSHIAISVDQLDAWRAHIIASGTLIEDPELDLYNAKRFFIRDPSGNRIEFVQWLEE